MWRRWRRWRHGRRCRRLAASCGEPALARYHEACAGLAVDRIDNTPLIAVDLELTGRDRHRHRIVALGWTQVDGGRIRIGSNRHLLIRPPSGPDGGAGGAADGGVAGGVGDSAVIHELRDSDIAGGVPIEVALQALFTAARGRVWVFHHADLDVAFLRQACLLWAGIAPRFIALDTLRIEHRLRSRREQPVRPGDLQLDKIRSRYGLPRYAAHHALSDALACAELMLALAAHLEPGSGLRLGPHLRFF
jgi:DNA polymerase-3 subunit epsilon